jgi:hypothetical protein
VGERGDGGELNGYSGWKIWTDEFCLRRQRRVWRQVITTFPPPRR